MFTVEDAVKSSFLEETAQSKGNEANMRNIRTGINLDIFLLRVPVKDVLILKLFCWINRGGGLTFCHGRDCCDSKPTTTARCNVSTAIFQACERRNTPKIFSTVGHNLFIF